MYYICVYDIADEKRLPKVLKTFRKYLNWVQNSVFEGELTSSQYVSLVAELEQIIKKAEDSIIMYKLREAKWVEKDVLGIEKNMIDNFL
jgi:CRISPR-associated protein Cas2